MMLTLYIKSSFVILLAMNWIGAGMSPSVLRPSQPNYLQLTRNEFGREVQKQPLLFEVNKDYLLELQLDRRGEIRKIEVAPRYFWQESNPEWREPGYKVGFLEKEYQETLAKVEQIKRIGSLVDKGTVGVVTNSKLWLTDQYEQAFIVRRIDSIAEPEQDSSELVHSFSIYFIRQIQGEVEDKHVANLSDGNKRLRLKIKGHWYLTIPEEFAKAAIGKRTLLYVAGPID
jgi:hypothetical protein